jgi:hypothetical protein
MVQDYQTGNIFVWLRGNTSYYFKGDGSYLLEPNTNGDEGYFNRVNTGVFYSYTGSSFINPNFNYTKFSFDNTSNITTIDGNNMGIMQKNTIEFGQGISEKEINAGKIGYQRFSNGLDIIGAGTARGNRIINLYDNVNTNGEFCFMKQGQTVCSDDYQVILRSGDWDAGPSNSTNNTWSGTVSGTRTKVIPITFNPPLSVNPSNVDINYTTYDISGNLRLNTPVIAWNTDKKTGFTLTLGTWDNTQIYTLKGTYTVYV